jgi:histidine phosphotransferase ChpT
MNDAHPVQPDPLLLARLIGTRLCHDMAAPVGAVANGAELMGDDPSMIDAEMLGLLTGSAAAASLRLRTLRAAFGMGGALEAAEIPRLLKGWVAARTVVTPPLPESIGRLSSEDLQVLLNVGLIAHDATLAPTALVLTVDSSAAEVVVAAETAGRGVRDGDAFAQALRGAVEGLGPRTVQAWLVGALSRERGGRTVFEERGQGLRLTAILPAAIA